MLKYWLFKFFYKIILKSNFFKMCKKRIGGRLEIKPCTWECWWKWIDNCPNSNISKNRVSPDMLKWTFEDILKALNPNINIDSNEWVKNLIS